MTRYILGRFTSLILSLIAASFVIFAIVEGIPGDPAAFILGTGARPDTLAALQAELGVDRPFMVRYLSWAGGLLVGEFGRSYTYQTPVADLIADRVVVSLPLALMALALSTFIAFPAGVYAAARRGRFGDTAVVGATQVGVAVPNFWFAMLLVAFFAIKLRWFSSGGFPGWDEGLGTALKALFLPAIALALPQAAILTRVLRSALLDTLGEDYVRTARAKGLTRRQVLWRHAIRNALIPVLTIVGLQFSFLLAGAIVIEQIFYLPGLGRLIFLSISARDLIVVESTVMLLVFTVIVVNFAVDLTYAVVDPRLRRRA